MMSLVYSLLTQVGASAQCLPKQGFFGIHPWYQYLKVEYNPYSASCELNAHLFNPTTKAIDLTTLSLIGLGIVDILIRVAAILAVAYVIVGGIRYVTSQGEPDKTKHATNTITNALIGLVITIMAATLVRFLGDRLGG